MKKLLHKEIKAKLKSGNEKLSYNQKEINYSLLNFWQWSTSNILSNSTRGKFAEFIVGSAIDFDINNLREEWDAFDLLTTEGIKIEVKSASYIQSWNQNGFSKISFSIKPAKNEITENDGIKKIVHKRHADIYVFCLLNHKDQETIDPMKMEQWIFFVVPTYKLDNYQLNKISINLNSLQKLTNRILYSDLKNEIHSSYLEQNNFVKQL